MSGMAWVHGVHNHENVERARAVVVPAPLADVSSPCLKRRSARGETEVSCPPPGCPRGHTIRNAKPSSGPGCPRSRVSVVAHCSRDGRENRQGKQNANCKRAPHTALTSQTTEEPRDQLPRTWPVSRCGVHGGGAFTQLAPIGTESVALHGADLASAGRHGGGDTVGGGEGGRKKGKEKEEKKRKKELTGLGWAWSFRQICPATDVAERTEPWSTDMILARTITSVKVAGGHMDKHNKRRRFLGVHGVGKVHAKTRREDRQNQSGR